MSYTYNADNEKTSMTDGAGDTTNYGYDGDGNQLSVTAPGGGTTKNSFDGQNRLLTTTDPLGHITSNAYNLAGWQTSETDPDKNVTQYGYNNAGEMTSETNPLGYQETFGYDAAAQLTSQTDFNGQQTQYSYNEAGWKTGETWLNSQNQSIYQAAYAYNNAGELTSEQDPNSLYNYSYNSDGAMTQDIVTYPGVSSSPLVTLSYGYDSFGNRTSLTDSLGGSISYGYNGEHQLTSESFALNGMTGPQLSLTYDSMERLSGITRTDGTADTITSGYSYDNANRLTNITYTDTTKSLTLANYTYSYDSSGDVTGYQDANSSLTYTYDKTGQLLSASGTLGGSSYNASWTYDANGNRNMPGYQIGTGNELLSDGTYNYTYDKNGNTLTKTNIATGDEWFYTWNYHNQMTEAVEKTKGGVVENDEKYSYDVQGRLIGENVNGTQQRWTVFDGTNVYMDFNGAGTAVTERYVTDPMAYGTLYARVSATGTADWYVTDTLGSICQIVDTSGNVLDAIVYDPWGNIVSESNPSNGDRFKFAGGQYDSIQQTYLFTARWDNPQDGRWESSDPLGLSPNIDIYRHIDIDFYRYVSNDPVGLTDPRGTQAGKPTIIPGIEFGAKQTLTVNYCPPAIHWIVDLIPPKKPNSGFIVQHIVNSAVIYDCSGKPIFYKKENFWEAYPINDPKNNPKDWPPVFKDDFGFEGPGGTMGTYKVTGYAVYVTNWRPQSIVQGGTWHGPASPGHHASAGKMPTTDVEPAWWKEQNGIGRQLTLTWQCCIMCGGIDNQGSYSAVTWNNEL